MGATGVKYVRLHGHKYQVVVPIHGRRSCIGTYATVEEAVQARDAVLAGTTEDEAVEQTAMAVDPSIVEEPDIWAAFEQVQRVYDRLDPEQEGATVTLDDDAPALIVFSSDWHVGHQHCDMERLRTDLETVRDTPGVYLITGGDLFDNVITNSPPGAQFEELAPPRVQKLLVEAALSRVQGKVLTVLLGNHSARSIRDDDFDPAAYFAHKAGCPYLGYWGLLTVKLGEQEYRLLVAHSFRMSSYYNKTHSAKRMLDILADADAVFVGHRHDPASEHTWIRQSKRFLGQAGTYLQQSRYGKSLGYGRGIADMPGVLLWPDQRRIQGVDDAFGFGMHVLNSYRQDGPCRCRECRASQGSESQ